ncbi:efflux RND transporter permease subunit [Brumimicrobium oceani]|uniref:Copper transporter n=1 Tax=Brumimicrobium oceani TaxID=2100725 RepID=A0A2U2XB36_9FLAO|nr:efflux RND transporter permease subunit [Brumimicrobium oceani]PWH84977.1 copper transporter [Brumimicrobium oceani]
MEEKNKTKLFGISNWAVNNSKVVFLIIAILFIGGMFSYQSMPKENFPELQIPEIYIGIAKPGSSPKYMSEKIAEAVEKKVKTIKKVDEILSDSQHGYTTIRVKFDFGIDVNDGLNKVKDAVDQARAETDFPELPVEPNIFEINPSDFPIMNINLSGNSPKVLKDIAEDLKDLVEDLTEINEVNIRGVQEEEMRIDVDRLKAEAVQVSLDDIENAVAAEHATISGGEILMNGMRKTIMIDGEFQSAEELGEVIVKQEDYMPVKLKDIADVYFGDGDTTSFAREFGAPVVMLDIIKQGGENLLDAADKINALVQKAKDDNVIPKGVNVSITNDQSDQTRDMVSNLENSIIFGVILVTLVLLFFLGARNAMFVGVAIPLSMLMSFMILQTMGVTLNTIVLFALVLALGMLVDNGIVVVENIYRFMDEEKYPPFKAAIHGVSEVAWPIIASTATTLAAFVPLAVWPGIFGEFMKYLPITLMIVLGSSLFVALVINPVLTALYMTVEQSKPKKMKSFIAAVAFLGVGFLVVMLDAVLLGNIIMLIGLIGLLNTFIFFPGTIAFQEKLLPVLERWYKNFLTFALKGHRPILFIVGTFIMLILSVVVFALNQPKVEFFPSNQAKFANVFITHPIGTDIMETNKSTLIIEEKINEILAPYMEGTDLNNVKKSDFVQSIIAQVGKGTSEQGMDMGDTPHKARITIDFTEFQYRDSINATGYVLKKLQDELKGILPADVQISVKKNEMGPPQQAPINIELINTASGEYKDLILVATDVKKYLDREAVEGVDELKLNVEATRPEIPIIVDRDQVRKLNASTTQVGMAIRKALLGQDIATYTKDEENYDMVVRFQQNSRYDLDALLDQKLMFRNNKGVLLNIPIRSVIQDPEENISYTGVAREDQTSKVIISSDVTEGFNGNEVVAMLKEKMMDYANEDNLPKDVIYNFTGAQDEQAEEMAFLSNALLIAVFLILLIIVAQFNSFSTPAIILFSVVLSFIGVFLGLALSGQTFVIMMTMIGIISLAGVVVNNSIVLIDYTNLIRRENRDKAGLEETDLESDEEVLAATIRGGEVRLRPVLLTAITTVLGLLPLAIGLNIDFVGLLNEYKPNIFIGGDNNMFFSPMAWTIIYGLTFATFLTLVIVPAMYLSLYRFKVWIYKKMKWTLKTNV